MEMVDEEFVHRPSTRFWTSCGVGPIPMVFRSAVAQEGMSEKALAVGGFIAENPHRLEAVFRTACLQPFEIKRRLRNIILESCRCFFGMLSKVNSNDRIAYYQYARDDNDVLVATILMVPSSISGSMKVTHRLG